MCEVTATTATVCNLSRARGYGLRVRELDVLLETVDSVSVALSELDELSTGIEQWFYDLTAELPGVALRFGLHDSTALFVEGEGPVVEAVASKFSDVRPGTR